MQRYPFILIILAGMTLRIAAAVPGTTYPSMKTVFTDPKTGNEVWRMTTDGSQHGLINAMGDQSSESSSWSPDSRYICYWKNGSTYRPQGVYMMEVATGAETYLAPSNSNVHGGQIFSADGTEVYYYHGTGGGKFDVKAVNVTTFRTRTIVGGLAMVAPQKITRNSDGSLIAIHQWGEPKQVAVLDPATGAFLPGWGWGGGTAGEDGSQWHPADPDVIFTVHGTKNVYNVRTLAAINPGDVGEIAHSSWHPDGSILVGRNTYEVATARKWTSGVYPGHPNINPADGDRGWQARLVADAHGTDGPYLYVMTVREFVDNRFPKALQRVWAVHYSTEETNHAHPHPHFSPNGRYILWQSDAADVSAGTPPGGAGTGGIDLFIAPYPSGATDTSGSGTGAAPDTLINGFAAAGTGTYQWSVIAPGALMYTDRAYAFTDVPEELAGGALLRTAMADKASDAYDDDFISFTVLKDASVSVLYTDVNAELETAWLNSTAGWNDVPYTTGSTVPGDGEAERKVRQRFVTAGTMVRLGGQGGTSSATSMYNVVVVPGAEPAAVMPWRIRTGPDGGRILRFDVAGRPVASAGVRPGIHITVYGADGRPGKELLLPGAGGYWSITAKGAKMWNGH